MVHLPLSWDDPATQLAIRKYMQSVRPDAPWCPSNIEFIRRINGLDSVDEVQRIVFDASYLVLGLGDVYLGAPVATPVDPRHRLVTTKYNPARTWTPENAVGIGGAYLCVYGMEGSGRIPVRGAHGADVEHVPSRRVPRHALAAALLRSDSFLSGVARRNCWRSATDFPHGRYPLRIEERRSGSRNITRFSPRFESERGGIQAAAAGGLRCRAGALGGGRSRPVRDGARDDAARRSRAGRGAGRVPPGAARR